MSAGKLLLHPGQSPIDANRVVERLREMAFLGDPYHHAAAPEARRWLAGERFLRLITFLGCSPYLAFEPPEDGSEDFCHIELDGPHATPRFRHGRNTRATQCPACRFRPDDWKALIARAETDASAPWVCPKCTTTTPLGELNWRRNAGSGRVFIVVHSVFPNEAVPNPELLSALKQASEGIEWRHFYVQ